MYRPTFQPEPRPKVLLTNISRITQHVEKRINEIGYGGYVSYSKVKKSKSRYLEVILSEKRHFIVRISDHPARENRWRCKFDIYTSEPRPGSVDYITFINIFKQLVSVGDTNGR